MMLEARGVAKSFGTLEVLKGVDLRVGQGDVVAILGPSGSGKTTLLRCLNFLERANEGRLTFDGEDFDLAHMGKKDILRLRRKTAFVFQNYNLFLNKTALENVTEGLVTARRMPKEEAVAKAERALDRVGCWTGKPLSQPALRRAAAAGGDRPGPGDQQRHHRHG